MDSKNGDCKAGNLRCPLGQMCKTVQISGQPASNVYASQQAQGRACQNVPPLGPNQYDLMIIGDRPYAADDYRGVPFQDDSSEIVMHFIQQAGIDITRTYMTKMVKCKPKPRRKPTVQEINICRDTYLRKEIELIKPKVVLLIGAEALRAFNLTGLGSINAIRGRVFKAKFAGWESGPTFKIVPTLNPATFLYKPNERLRARVQHDYIVIKNILDGNENPPEYFTPDWELINTPEKLEWLTHEIEKTSLIGFDTELACPIDKTISIFKSQLLTLQIAWSWDKTAVIPVHLHDPDAPEDQQFHIRPGFGSTHFKLLRDFVKRIFTNPNIAKAAHNFKFDENVLRFHFGVRLKGFRFDSMVMKHLYNENPPSNLEHLCDIWYQWGDYSQKVREIVGSGRKLKKSYDKVPDHILHPYGAVDALGTYRLTCSYNDLFQRKHKNLWQFYCEESHGLIKALAKAEYKGQLMSAKVHAALQGRYEQEQVDLLNRMRKYLWPEFSPTSSGDVIKAFRNLGVKDVDLRDDSNVSGYSANKNKLSDFTERTGKVGQLASDVMTYRNRTKMISTYLVNATNDLDTDGRLRYSWTQAGPVTGRLSCRFFHQMPAIDDKIVLDANERYIPIDKRDKIMRDLFEAPPSYKYVYGDFSQVELRILAILSQDTEMLSILESGGDLHKATAFEFLRSEWPGLKENDISKQNRTQVGKRINFGLAYGSEGHSLVKTGKWIDAKGRERNFTWQMLNAGMDRWKKRFIGIGQFIDMMPDIVRGYGCTATNVFGRERHFGPLLNHHSNYERAKAERECINFFIQSVASCLTNRTIINVDNILEKYNIPDDVICLVNTVHDSVAYEVRDDYVEWFTKALLAISMQPWPQLFNKQFRMDIGVGQYWTAAEMAA